MSIRLLQQAVGPWPMNTYLIICDLTGQSAIVDPGADAETILALAAGTRVTKILVTHGHYDHVDALEAVRQATGAPVHLHPAEALQVRDDQEIRLAYDVPLEDGLLIPVGEVQVRAMHVPGHTPGMTCFDLLDGRILVGDTVFVGGPGKTWSAQDFLTTLQNMQKIVFAWPDDTIFYPGHGPAGRIGDERPAFEAFLKRDRPEGLYGDVTWI